ncbi:hypothetical protein NKDENANG_01481 [Candidatus Entotheonellaceae bacterium PAL068K]
MLPEQHPRAAVKPQYFQDAAVDALHQMVLVLAEEVFTLRDKLDAVVALHDRGQLPTTPTLDALDTDALFTARRQAFVARFLEPLQELLEREGAENTDAWERPPFNPTHPSKPETP